MEFCRILLCFLGALASVRATAVDNWVEYVRGYDVDPTSKDCRMRMPHRVVVGPFGTHSLF